MEQYTFKQYLLMGVMGAVSLSFAAGMFWVMSAEEGKAYADPKTGCYDVASGRTDILFDRSPPRTFTSQNRDILQFIEDHLEYKMAVNERISWYSTAGDVISSVITPRFTFCRPAKTPEELESIADTSVTQQYLDRQSKALFKDKIKPLVLEELLSDDKAREINHSPIIQMVQSLSKSSGFKAEKGKRSIVLVSDLMQNDTNISFGLKGHLPPFSQWKQTKHYKMLAPDRMEGVEVQILVLDRGWPEPSRYATHRELRSFFEALFYDAGAAKVSYRRLNLHCTAEERARSQQQNTGFHCK